MPERYLGHTLGKYRVEELVGSGGFAWVYRGFDPELEIPVALKVLKPQFAGDATFEERFRREASTAAKLRHPNIIKIYAVGRDGDAVYFAMDYLPSGLAEKLEATDWLAEEFVLRMGIDVARALGFAHREGVIHRDIKVDNILFDPHGNAVVADFGIARAVSGYTQQTGTNMVVGTPQYFAPEQARAKPLDGRADIYSLGVTLFRSAAGRLPFEGEDWYEIARQHVEDPPPSLRGLNPSLTDGFERVVLRCLAKHADDRPATGEQLADELATVLQTSHDTSGSRGVYLSGSESPTLVTPIDRGSPQRSPTARAFLRRAAPLLILFVALGALAVPLIARRATESDPPLPPPDSLVAAVPLPVTPPESVLAPPLVDTVARPDTTATAPRKDSTRSHAAPPISPARLAVTAPPNARVSVNGLAVSNGSWRADTFKPGEYSVSATIPASAACESATDEQSVRLRAGTLRDVTLAPRPCGSIDISVLNVGGGARYTIVSADGTTKREGALPLSAPVVVPVGQYRVTAQQPLCAAYDNEGVNVTAESATKVTFRLVCDKN